MNSETIKKASAIYFSLLKEKVIDESSEHFQSYFEPDVRQTVLLLKHQNGFIWLSSQQALFLRLILPI